MERPNLTMREDAAGVLFGAGMGADVGVEAKSGGGLGFEWRNLVWGVVNIGYGAKTFHFGAKISFWSEMKFCMSLYYFRLLAIEHN